VRLVRRDLEFSSMPRADLAVPLLDCRVGSPAALLLFPVFPRSLRVNGPPERREACPKLLRSSTVVLAHVCCALRTLLFQRQHQPPQSERSLWGNTWTPSQGNVTISPSRSSPISVSF